MSYKDFINKVRYWDNILAKWLMRHFYITFFQIVLVIIFFIWFINLIRVVDANFQVNQSNLMEKIFMTQSINTTIIVLLMILNSFWLLYLFSGIQRLRAILKDISYNTSKIHQLKPKQNTAKP